MSDVRRRGAGNTSVADGSSLQTGLARGEKLHECAVEASLSRRAGLHVCGSCRFPYCAANGAIEVFAACPLPFQLGVRELSYWRTALLRVSVAYAVHVKSL